MVVWGHMQSTPHAMPPMPAMRRDLLTATATSSVNLSVKFDMPLLLSHHLCVLIKVGKSHQKQEGWHLWYYG